MTPAPDRYAVLKKIGQGSQATIYLVTRKQSTGLYVVKERKLAASKRSAEQALIEAEILRKMSRHPCVIRFKEATISPSGDLLSICMEYASGGDLHTTLARHKKQGTVPSPDQVCSWLAQVSLGLHGLHRGLLIHRDIKPANLLLLHDGRIVLGDFGASRSMWSDELAKTFVGTPHYMSPELITGGAYDMKSDVWALGIVAFEASTLHKPFAFKHGGIPMTLADLTRRVQRGLGEWDLLRGVQLEDLILQMLSDDKDQRPRMDQVLRHPQVSRGVAGFVRDLARGKFHLSVSRAEALMDQCASLGLRQMCRTAVCVGVAMKEARDSEARYGAQM